MTGQHRKPGQPDQPLLVRKVDSQKALESIGATVARAINETAESLRKIRGWCEDADKIVCSHQSEHECVRCEAIKDCAAAIRTLLPDVPPSAEGVEQVDGTRVTRDNHWSGGTDSGNHSDDREY